MIKRLGLPKGTLASETQIDLSSRVSQPTLGLFPEQTSRATLHHQMNVIWHDDKAVQVITHTVKVQQRIGHQLSKLGSAKNTFTVALVQSVEPASGSNTSILGLQGTGKRLGFRKLMEVAVVAIVAEPSNDFRMPSSNDFAWHGIFRAKGNKRRRAGLEPMGQTPRSTFDFGLWIKCPKNDAFVLTHASHVARVSDSEQES